MKGPGNKIKMTETSTLNADAQAEASRLLDDLEFEMLAGGLKISVEYMEVCTLEEHIDVKTQAKHRRGQERRRILLTSRCLLRLCLRYL